MRCLAEACVKLSLWCPTAPGSPEAERHHTVERRQVNGTLCICDRVRYVGGKKALPGFI